MEIYGDLWKWIAVVGELSIYLIDVIEAWIRHELISNL